MTLIYCAAHILSNQSFPFDFQNKCFEFILKSFYKFQIKTADSILVCWQMMGNVWERILDFCKEKKINLDRPSHRVLWLCCPAPVYDEQTPETSLVHTPACLRCTPWETQPASVHLVIDIPLYFVKIWYFIFKHIYIYIYIILYIYSIYIYIYKNIF